MRIEETGQEGVFALIYNEEWLAVGRREKMERLRDLELPDAKYRVNQAVTYRGNPHHIKKMCVQLLTDTDGEYYLEWTYNLSGMWSHGNVLENNLDKEN